MNRAGTQINSPVAAILYLIQRISYGPFGRHHTGYLQLMLM